MSVLNIVVFYLWLCWHFIHSHLQAPGDVTLSDVDLAIASEAVILAFNVSVPGSVESTAEEKGVEIRKYRVIYDMVDDVRKAMEGMLDAVEVRDGGTQTGREEGGGEEKGVDICKWGASCIMVSARY